MRPSDSSPTRHLVYTVALDPPGSIGQQLRGSSLLRTWFSGDVVIFRNTEAPLFPVERAGLTEVYLETPDFQSEGDAQEAWRYPESRKLTDPVFRLEAHGAGPRYRRDAAGKDELPPGALHADILLR